MSTVMNIINQRALVAALTEFGERLGAQLGDACPRDTFQLALAECLKEANLPQQKVKATKAKVAKGPSKMPSKRKKRSSRRKSSKSSKRRRMKRLQNSQERRRSRSSSTIP